MGYVILDNNIIKQIAIGFSDVPFKTDKQCQVIEISDELAGKIAMYPDEWVFVDGEFVHHPKERPQLPTLEQRIAALEDTILATIGLM